jgi:hypothetical protein
MSVAFLLPFFAALRNNSRVSSLRIQQIQEQTLAS